MVRRTNNRRKCKAIKDRIQWCILSYNIEGGLKGRIFYDDKGRGRRIVIYLSKILSGKKDVEVGDFFGRKGPAVNWVVKAAGERLDKEKLKGNSINE